MMPTRGFSESEAQIGLFVTSALPGDVLITVKNYHLIYDTVPIIYLLVTPGKDEHDMIVTL